MNEILSVRETVQSVSKDLNQELMVPVTKEEVKEAVFSMHPEKSSGLDGLNPAFFQTYWDIMGDDMSNFCKVFFDTKELPHGINCTLVCLISKVKQPKQMTDLRPISLCNVLMRILSKIMANRLKSCLSSIIYDKQSAFIEWRLLTDNALIAFELNHYIKRKAQGKNGVASLKIDVSKAYDRLEWFFLRNMLNKFGFNKMWIERVMTCYEETWLIHGCKVARGAPTISHLLFADDCYLFFRASEMETDNIKRILNRYERMLGQAINHNKSSVLFSPNTNAENRSLVCEKLEVNATNTPGKYLGMPMHLGKNKTAVFGFLNDRVRQKLQG